MHKGHLDNNEEQIKETLGMNDIISVLRNEFSNIYLVDCKSQQIEIYRYKNQAVGVKEILQTKQPYKACHTEIHRRERCFGGSEEDERGCGF